MTLVIECSVVACEVKEHFTGNSDASLRKKIAAGGWVFDPPYLESRCPEHEKGEYDMKPGTGEEV